MSRVGAGLPGMAMEKASLVTIDSFLVGGLTFKYNPTQFSLSRSTSWDNPGVSMETQWAPPLYQSTSPTSISMEIFLDAFEELFGDVTGDVQKLIDWTKPGPSNEPPLLQFRWGASQALRGMYFYLASVQATYTLFRVDGTPIRATCNISLIEATNPASRQNPTSGGQSGIARPHRRRDPPLHRLGALRRAELLASDRRPQRHRRPVPRQPRDRDPDPPAA
jgi:hypothetical protein